MGIPEYRWIKRGETQWSALERLGTENVSLRAEVERYQAVTTEQHDEIARLRAENERLRAALKNCRMYAAREIRRHERARDRGVAPSAVSDGWRHVLRFCEEAGVVANVLREEEDAKEPDHA